MSENVPKEPATLAELLWYIKRYEKSIFVRVKLGEEGWGTMSLADISAKDWGEKVAGFLERGILPTRVKEEGE